MSEKPIKVRILPNVFEDGHDVYVRIGRARMLPPVFEPVETGGVLKPSIQGGEGTAFIRAMLNAAWDAGFRPDGFDDTRESMKATNRHLEDMRALAFGKLKVDRP